MTKYLFLTFICLAISAPAMLKGNEAEEVLSAYTNASWVLPHWRKFHAMDEFLAIKGYVGITTKRSFAVDEDAVYELSGKFRTPSNQAHLSRFEFGFVPFDEDGKPLTSKGYSSKTDSFGTLAKDVKPGDTAVFVNCKKSWWKTDIAFNARKNFSDLPNKDLHKIKVLKKIENGYELTLDKPVTKAYAAGTGVRNHFSMNWIFTVNRYQKAPKEWTAFSGKISGFEKGIPNEKRWWPGTVRAKVFLLIPVNSALEFKDVVVRKMEPAKKGGK